jgi:hypothetical protein
LLSRYSVKAIKYNHISALPTGCLWNDLWPNIAAALDLIAFGNIAMKGLQKINRLPQNFFEGVKPQRSALIIETDKRQQSPPLPEIPIKPNPTVQDPEQRFWIPERICRLGANWQGNTFWYDLVGNPTWRSPSPPLFFSSKRKKQAKYSITGFS